MNQLLRLLDAAQDWPTPPSVYVTTLAAVAPALAWRGPTTVIGECDRRRPLRAVGVLFRAARFALRERPDVVVTTGSMPLALVCAWCKLLGARIVWIDSIANSSRPSVSGRFVRTFADLFLVQWPDVAKRTPRAEFAGALV